MELSGITAEASNSANSALVSKRSVSGGGSIACRELIKTVSANILLKSSTLNTDAFVPFTSDLVETVGLSISLLNRQLSRVLLCVRLAPGVHI